MRLSPQRCEASLARRAVGTAPESSARPCDKVVVGDLGPEELPIAPPVGPVEPAGATGARNRDAEVSDAIRTGRGCGLKRKGSSQSLTTGQVRVRVMPSTAWIFETT